MGDVGPGRSRTAGPHGPMGLTWSAGMLANVRQVHVNALPYGVGVVVPARVNAAHVAYLQTCVERLYAQDQVIGGALLVGSALSLLARARRMLDEADFSETVGRRLLSVSGELSICAGRLAFDAAMGELAGTLYGEACLYATQAGDTRLLVQAALASAARSSRPGGDQPSGGREALRVLDMAYESARHWATPRVYAMLALHEALARAALGHAEEHREAMARAIREFERGPHEDDPHWADSLNTGDFSTAQGVGALALGRLATAADRLRAAADDLSAGARDRLWARAMLASVLLTMGDERAAFQEGMRVLPPLGGTVLSSRVRETLLPLRRAAWSTDQALADAFATAFDCITS